MADIITFSWISLSIVSDNGRAFSCILDWLGSSLISRWRQCWFVIGDSHGMLCKYSVGLWIITPFTPFLLTVVFSYFFFLYFLYFWENFVCLNFIVYALEKLFSLSLSLFLLGSSKVKLSVIGFSGSLVRWQGSD